jgi:hypothetical protein
MNDTDTDLALISGRLDGDGDEVPGDHPIENPGPPDEPVEGDPLNEPHPDEPGVESDGEAGPTENPDV